MAEIFARLVLRHSASRQLTELGLLLCMIGAVVLAVTALTRHRADGRVTGGLLLALGVLFLLVAVHYGVNPFRGGGRG